MNRHNSYDEWLSSLLQKDPSHVKEFMTSLMEGDDGLSVEEALKHTIYRVGVKEFAEFVGVDQPNVTGFLRGTRKPKRETLNTYLKPFGLKVKFCLDEVA